MAGCGDGEATPTAPLGTDTNFSCFALSGLTLSPLNEEMLYLGSLANL